MVSVIIYLIQPINGLVLSLASFKVVNKHAICVFFNGLLLKNFIAAKYFNSLLHSLYMQNKVLVMWNRLRKLTQSLTRVYSYSKCIYCLNNKCLKKIVKSL